jgi:hypothetical protein
MQSFVQGIALDNDDDDGSNSNNNNNLSIGSRNALF